MTDRGTWWSVTAFNDEISLLEDSKQYPSYVKKVYGGKEECPDTKKIHFQGALQLRSQQRLGTLKKWLPTAHFEIARNKDALQKYAMKEETAVGQKTERVNEVEHISVEKILLKLADEWDSEIYDEYLDQLGDPKEAFKSSYWHAVRAILRSAEEYRKVCHLFARADVITLWDRTRKVWLEVSEGNSITPSAQQFSQELVQCQESSSSAETADIASDQREHAAVPLCVDRD